MSFDATTWVEQLGFLGSFGVYSGALGGVSLLGGPLVYVYGKRIRAFTAGKLRGWDPAAHAGAGGPTTPTSPISPTSATDIVERREEV